MKFWLSCSNSCITYGIGLINIVHMLPLPHQKKPWDSMTTPIWTRILVVQFPCIKGGGGELQKLHIRIPLCCGIDVEDPIHIFYYLHGGQKNMLLCHSTNSQGDEWTQAVRLENGTGLADQKSLDCTGRSFQPSHKHVFSNFASTKQDRMLIKHYEVTLAANQAPRRSDQRVVFFFNILCLE